MICTILTWIVIFASAYISGAFLLSFSSCDKVHATEWYLTAGLAFLCVYAQIFSLFHRVGTLALFSLFLICLLFLLYLYRRSMLPAIPAQGTEKAVFVILLIIAFAFLTAQVPSAYDTSLYHAQAIRWIEEYGVVPGLGNLHNRLAYNSSFMALQTLFSFRWLFGKSLHSVNGFVSVCAVCYAVLTQSGKKNAHLSDFLKLSVLVYLYEERDQISSPNTDLMALSMVWFILVKWTELAEQKEKSTTPYCILCVLSVYTMTLKLSAALLVLLTVYPLVILIRRKETGKLLASLLAGIICVMPWMARSVILSGYLIYPVYQIDLFNVDWKMPASVLKYDSLEIKAWGRALKDVALLKEPISVWLPVWYQSLSAEYKVLTVTALIGLIISAASVIIGLKRNQVSFAAACAQIICVACTCMWFSSSPDIRYGKIYVLLWNSYLLYLLFHRIGMPVIELIAIPMLAVLLSTVLVHESGIIVREADYPHYSVTGTDFSGVTVYLPDGGDQVGYDYFPSTPYGGQLEKIELRGEDLSDGFRVKEEFRLEHRNAYGNLW
jgi:hypothetical protein